MNDRYEKSASIIEAYKLLRRTRAYALISKKWVAVGEEWEEINCHDNYR